MAVPAALDTPSTATSSVPTSISTEHSEIAGALDWRDRAICSSEDNTTLFFPVGVTGNAALQIEKAKQVCTECPVRLACLEYAITTNQEYGIWGGASEEERRAIRRVWRREQREKKARIAAERKAQRDARRLQEAAESECRAG